MGWRIRKFAGRDCTPEDRCPAQPGVDWAPALDQFYFAHRHLADHERDTDGHDRRRAGAIYHGRAIQRFGRYRIHRVVWNFGHGWDHHPVAVQSTDRIWARSGYCGFADRRIANAPGPDDLHHCWHRLVAGSTVLGDWIASAKTAGNCGG